MRRILQITRSSDKQTDLSPFDDRQIVLQALSRHDSVRISHVLSVNDYYTHRSGARDYQEQDLIIPLSVFHIGIGTPY